MRIDYIRFDNDKFEDVERIVNIFWYRLWHWQAWADSV